MNNEYNDIIDMPYKKSNKHPQMPMRDRAAQFAPFSALTGYSDTVSEVERHTDNERLLDEYEISEIDRKLQFILDNLICTPTVKATYFVPDELKSGGDYQTICDKVVLLDDYEKKMIFESGASICFDKIVSLDIEFEK